MHLCRWRRHVHTAAEWPALYGAAIAHRPRLNKTYQQTHSRHSSTGIRRPFVPRPGFRGALGTPDRLPVQYTGVITNGDSDTQSNDEARPSPSKALTLTWDDPGDADNSSGSSSGYRPVQCSRTKDMETLSRELPALLHRFTPWVGKGRKSQWRLAFEGNAINLAIQTPNRTEADLLEARIMVIANKMRHHPHIAKVDTRIGCQMLITCTTHWPPGLGMKDIDLAHAIMKIVTEWVDELRIEAAQQYSGNLIKLVAKHRDEINAATGNQNTESESLVAGEAAEVSKSIEIDSEELHTAIAAIDNPTTHGDSPVATDIDKIAVSKSD